MRRVTTLAPAQSWGTSSLSDKRAPPRRPGAPVQSLIPQSVSPPKGSRRCRRGRGSPHAATPARKRLPARLFRDVALENSNWSAYSALQVHRRRPRRCRSPAQNPPRYNFLTLARRCARAPVTLKPAFSCIPHVFPETPKAAPPVTKNARLYMASPFVYSGKPRTPRRPSPRGKGVGRNRIRQNFRLRFKDSMAHPQRVPVELHSSSSRMSEEAEPIITVWRGSNKIPPAVTGTRAAPYSPKSERVFFSPCATRRAQSP